MIEIGEPLASVKVEQFKSLNNLIQIQFLTEKGTRIYISFRGDETRRQLLAGLILPQEVA